MDNDSVTLWLRRFSQGDQEAARRLWNRYSSGLVRLVHGRFRGAVSAAADEEDLVQSVFQELWTGAADGRLDTVKDRTELWWLLVAITRRKAINRRAYNIRRKRARQARSLSQLQTFSDESSWTPPESAADDQPPAELVLMLEEEQQRLLALLGGNVLRLIAVWKMEGDTHEEIAKKLGVTPRTVIRKLNLIRETWSKELALE